MHGLEPTLEDIVVALGPAQTELILVLEAAENLPRGIAGVKR
jgi:hypothetical protein